MKKTLSIIAFTLAFVTSAFGQNQFAGTNSASFKVGLTTGLSSLFAGTNIPLTKTICTAVSTTETNLCGTEVYLNGETAPLLYVSPQQINLFVADKYFGRTVNIRVRSSNGTEQFASLYVSNNPGLFTANGRGVGQVAAVQTSNGVNYDATAYFSADSNDFTGIPVHSKGSDGQQNYLVLYGTGLTANTKCVAIGNGYTYEWTVTFAGKHPFLLGVDQVNVKVPSNPLPAGTYTVKLTSNGVESNAGKITLSGF